ncbi:MAG: lipopolysaccharide transport periplasmic protein LptA [Gammaproteobacteria bacterium]|nr:lipopolysaccharide transport periplasmic protein LptA [Gammaproteobacteria bacterium]
MLGCLDRLPLSSFGPRAPSPTGHRAPGGDSAAWRPIARSVPTGSPVPTGSQADFRQSLRSRRNPRSHGRLFQDATLGLARALAVGLALGLGLVPTGPAQALESDQQQPLSLESDAAEMDEAKRLSVYTGKVIVRQGTLEIRADQVTIHHAEDKRPELIIATGQPATYQQQVEGEQRPIQAEALRMEYQATKDEITLIDQAVVFQGADTFRSDRIVYDRLNARVKAGTSAQGKERVRIQITPQTEPGTRP